MGLRDDDIVIAIREKNISVIIDSLFNKQLQSISSGYRIETDLWDYKLYIPKLNGEEIEWAEIAKDVLGFYNNRGGLLVFGVEDSTYLLKGLNSTIKIDSKLFNDKIRKYIGDKIWVEFQIENINSINIGIAVIPPKTSSIEKFKRNSPEKKGKHFFLEGGTAIRNNDSTYVHSPKDTKNIEFERNFEILRKYEIDEPYYRIMCKEYSEFIYREKLCFEIKKALNYKRAAVVSIIGIGGVGKTALATWAVLSAYKVEEFEYIVSITAKDRELTSKGISAIKQDLATFENLIDTIIDVLGLEDIKELLIDEKEAMLREYMTDTKGLLFIDNLETITDTKIIDFLDDLPDGVKAIVTSRRNLVKISVYPIEVVTMSNSEIINFINSIIRESQNIYAKALSETEKERIGIACNGIPLAIKWIMNKSKSVQELLNITYQMEKSGFIGDELLEFSFRRIFEGLCIYEKDILRVLAIFPSISSEAIIKGSNLTPDEYFKNIEILVSDTLVYKSFDDNIKDYVYNVLPLTRSFLLKHVIKSSDEQEIRRRLTNWFEALDISDPGERLIHREMRQGNKNPGDVLTELAKVALKRGDETSAKEFFTQATSRDPRNWRVYRDFAEYFRHYKKSTSEALKYYELAIEYSLKENDKYDIARLHREYALMLKDSGEKNATEKAILHAEKAFGLLPNDPICAKLLANLYSRKGHYKKVIEVLEPFIKVNNKKTQLLLIPYLKKAYEETGEMKKLGELKILNTKLSKPIYPI